MLLCINRACHTDVPPKISIDLPDLSFSVDGKVQTSPAAEFPIIVNGNIHGHHPSSNTQNTQNSNTPYAKYAKYVKYAKYAKPQYPLRKIRKIRKTPIPLTQNT